MYRRGPLFSKYETVSRKRIGCRMTRQKKSIDRPDKIVALSQQTNGSLHVPSGIDRINRSKG